MSNAASSQQAAFQAGSSSTAPLNTPTLITPVITPLIATATLKASRPRYGYAATLDATDERMAELNAQYAERGWDDTELWDLQWSTTRYLADLLPAWLQDRTDIVGEQRSLLAGLAEVIRFVVDSRDSDALTERHVYVTLAASVNGVIDQFSQYPDLAILLSGWLAERLEAFAEMTHSYPSDLTMDQWRDILNAMATSLRIIVRDTGRLDDPRSERALSLLRTWFIDLWS